MGGDSVLDSVSAIDGDGILAADGYSAGRYSVLTVDGDVACLINECCVVTLLW